MTTKFILQRNVAITKTKDYSKRQLATHTVNTGMVCSLGCKFCTNPSYVYRHEFFKEIKYTAFELFEQNVGVIDPWTPIRTAKTGYKLNKTDIVLISALLDPYAPESFEIGLGRKCIEAVLSKSEAYVRVLTRSTSVLYDLDLFKYYKDRISIGISIPAPLSKDNFCKMLEQNCSSISERLEAYRILHENGISSFGMISPCMPALINGKSDIHSILSSLAKFEPDGIWIEPISIKNNNIEKCSKEFETHGYDKMARELKLFATKPSYTSYIKSLIGASTDSARSLGILDKTKIIINSDGDGFDVDDSAVVWLKR